jgi:hypothetical protein
VDTDSRSRSGRTEWSASRERLFLFCPSGGEGKMRREDSLVIRLTEAERKAINRLADAQRLPVSTAARRILLDMADALEPEGQNDTNRRR